MFISYEAFNRNFDVVEGDECSSGGRRVRCFVLLCFDAFWALNQEHAVALLCLDRRSEIICPVTVGNLFLCPIYNIMCSISALYCGGTNCGDITASKGLTNGETDRLFTGEALAHHVVPESSVAEEVEDRGRPITIPPRKPSLHTCPCVCASSWLRTSSWK